MSARTGAGAPPRDTISPRDVARASSLRRSAVRIVASVLTMLLAGDLAAQANPARQPARRPVRQPSARPAPPAQQPQRAEHPCGFSADTTGGADSLTTTYAVGGVRVIHRCVTANDVVAANLYLLGGVRQTTAENAGIEPLLLEASERGTRSYPKNELRRRMARLGSAIAVAPGVDWTVLGLRSTTDAFDSTWVILADRLMHPTLDAGEFELIREQLVNALRQRQESADALVAQLADSLAWEGHPYMREPVGSEASVARLNIADLRKYHAEQMVTSRMLLVVVGNVERSRVERLVSQTVGRLPAGDYQWTLPPAPAAVRTSLLTVRRPLPTNYIMGYFQGPPASSPDYQALRVASAALSGRLFGEIRSRRTLTYAVESPFVERALATGGLYVTTVQPDTVLAIMRREIDDLQSQLVPERGLELLVSQFITEYFLDNETNAAQADFLARAHLFRGDWRAAGRFVDELRQVTPEQVRRVARQYMRNIRFAYVGDPSRVRESSVRGF